MSSPTLYAAERIAPNGKTIHQILDEDGYPFHEWLAGAPIYRHLDALWVLLPRRCDGCRDYWRNCGEGDPADSTCGGRGWVYPPMPDWFRVLLGVPLQGTAEDRWQRHLQLTWRVMRVFDE